jgi:hypothetical protein
MRAEGRRLRCPDCGAEGDEDLPEPTAAESGQPEGPGDLAAPGEATPPAPKRPGPARPRSFGACLLLGIVTLGIYFLYYQYRVFKEVDEDAGFRHLAGLFWSSFGVLALGLVAAALAADALGGVPRLFGMLGVLVALPLAAYLWLEASQLRRARAALGLAPMAPRNALAGLTLAATLTDAFVAHDAARLVLAVAILLGQLSAFWVLHQAIHEYWATRRRGVPLRPAARGRAAPA